MKSIRARSLRVTVDFVTRGTRNTNSRFFDQTGPDTGFDSIGDLPQMVSLSGFLNSQDATDQLPRVTLYSLNPADNYAFAALIGNFQDGSVPGLERGEPRTSTGSD